MNISPLFANNSYGFVGHHDGDERMPMDDGSPSQQPQRRSPTVSRPSVDRPSPRSHPYPRPTPVSEHVRGGNASGGESGVTYRFKPAKTGIDIGFHCMAKHWEASLGRVVYCLDMYDKLKKKPDESYVSEDAAEKARKLKDAHDALRVKYDGHVPQAVDFEVGSDIIGINKRTKLPIIIASAATLVEGSKFQRLACLRTASPDPSSSTQLYTLAQQVTQLQQNHQQMMEFQQQQQQIIHNLT